MAQDDIKKEAAVSVISRTDSSNSAPSLKSPRTPRFAEATSVDSPIEPGVNSTAPFDAPPLTSKYLMPQAQPSDVGFGYIGEQNPAHQSVEMPNTPRSPLKSALRTPGAPPRRIDTPLFSPTWKEEEYLEEREGLTEKEQQKDLAIKVRVRVAKMALRFTNFSCSLIVLSMLSSTFAIFNATKSLPARNNLPPWAMNTKKWPAITLLCISCVSLFMAVLIFVGYWKGGHKRASKAAAYYSMFAIGWFIFSTVMWVIGAVVLQQARANSGGNDIWGWSCKNNARKTVFQNDVHYELVCRFQNWSLMCALIEIVVEVITISIYSVMFYRFYSKRRLRKSMAKRDAARSDLYLAQLKSQSAPNTPGVSSPRDGGYNPLFSPRFAEKSQNVDEISVAEEGQSVRYIDATTGAPASAQPFKLQSPPIKKSTPKLGQEGFPLPADHEPMPRHDDEPEPFDPSAPAIPESHAPVFAESEAEPEHAPAADGEEEYAAVPIPGAYEGAINSPTHVPQDQGYFQAL